METPARPQLVCGADAEAGVETARSITNQRLFEVEGTRSDPFKNRSEPERNCNNGSGNAICPTIGIQQNIDLFRMQ
jgi:hypothetical protein